MHEKFKILSNDVKIPLVGFGTYKSGNDEETARLVIKALNAGYRMIDTAYFYGNEVGIGKGIKDSEINREEIFLVTKLWNDDHGYEKTIEAFNKSLNNLQVDYIDLYLIHWPNKLNNETWKAFEYLYETGKVKAIGVCNFKVNHLEDLKKSAKIMPMINQVEIHPFSNKNEILNYCKDNNIQVIAWSPISRGRVFSSDLMVNLSEKYKKTIAQIVLRWHIQRGIIPIPKSSNEDIEAINSLNEGDYVSVSKPPINTIYNEAK